MGYCRLLFSLILVSQIQQSLGVIFSTYLIDTFAASISGYAAISLDLEVNSPYIPWVSYLEHDGGDFNVAAYYASQWNFDGVDVSSSTVSGRASNIKLASTGRVHACYTEDTGASQTAAWHATKSGGIWTKTRLGNTFSSSFVRSSTCNIAMDTASPQNAHVAYVGSGWGCFYARWSGASSTFDLISPGTASSITDVYTLSNCGYPNVGLTLTGGVSDVYYAYIIAQQVRVFQFVQASASWVALTGSPVQTTAGSFIDLTMITVADPTPNNRIKLAYTEVDTFQTPLNTWFTQWASTFWSHSNYFGANVGVTSMSMTLDSNKLPHFSYVIPNAPNAGDCRYGHYTGSSFTSQLIANVGTSTTVWTSIRLDGLGNPRFVYYDAINKQARMAAGCQDCANDFVDISCSTFSVPNCVSCNSRNRNNLGVSESCGTCMTGFYDVVSGAASGTSQCNACLTCSGTQFQTVACSANQNRQCQTCANCNVVGSFNLTTCQPLTDATCQTCTNVFRVDAGAGTCGACTSGYFNVATGSGGTVACTLCTATCGVGFYQTQACTPTTDRTCGTLVQSIVIMLVLILAALAKMDILT